LREYASCRVESRLEGFHDPLANFGNSGMTDKLADALHLCGTARYNVNIREKMGRTGTQCNGKSNAPSHFSDVAPFYNHSDLAEINKLAVAVGIDMPYQNIRKLPDDTGERFFFLSTCVNRRSEICIICGIQEMTDAHVACVKKTSSRWLIGTLVRDSSGIRTTTRTVTSCHNIHETMIAVAGSNLTTALQTTDNDGGTESNETSLEELSRSVARAKKTASASKVAQVLNQDMPPTPATTACSVQPIAEVVSPTTTAACTVQSRISPSADDQLAQTKISSNQKATTASFVPSLSPANRMEVPLPIAPKPVPPLSQPPWIFRVPYLQEMRGRLWHFTAPVPTPG